MQAKEESIPLVGVDERSKFYLTDQAKRLLNSIHKPIAVVTIAGLYRSGKSSLANRLLRTRNAFATGSSVGAVTKGLRVWGRPIAAEDEEGREFVYLAVDSEGVGSCEQEVQHDLKILLLAFLISSTVIYNSVGAIDEPALDQLRTVLALRQALPAAAHPAKLVWVLRDFALQLVAKNGRELTPNDYLEHCLEELPSTAPEARKKNDIRRAIKDTFARRTCFPLVRPTIREDDLRDLEHCALRPEFLEGIEAIREEVFTGAGADVKRIGGTAVSGQLLGALLEECCQQLNDGRMPEIRTTWEAVRECWSESAFEATAAEARDEVARLALPVAQEELRTHLNNIHNRAYLRLERDFQDLPLFQKYHRQYLHLAQKLNRDAKRTNAQLNREKTLRELREFVRNNLSLQQVEPTSLSLLKVLVERMELRTRGEPEAYEYVLSVLFDAMHVSEQKAVQAHREAQERLQLLESGCQDRRNADLALAAARHDYHEALKTINNLKLTQETLQKDAALARQQLELQQAAARTAQQEAEAKTQALLKQLEEAAARARLRAEEQAGLARRLREEKSELEHEVESLKEQRLRGGLSERKEIIFEEKMKETWDRFEEERLFFRRELDKLRKQSEAHLQKYEEERRSREREGEQFAREREAFTAKERESLQQLQQLKNLHTETKKTYNATFEALRENDRIFKSIENVPAATRHTPHKPQTADLLRRQFEVELERARAGLEEEVAQLKGELARANHLTHQHQLRLADQESRYRSCITDRERLEKELQTANLRFSETVGEIELAKERERSLYEESIVRLLNNLEKRDSASLHRR